MPSPRLDPGWVRPALNALPSGWQAVQVGSVSRTVAGGRLRLTKESHYQNAGIPAFSAAGQDGYVDRAEFDDTDAVILSSVGANCGRCFLAEGTWTTLANVQAIITSPQISARYLHYRVNRDDYWPRSGSAQPFIKPSDIARCWVSLPPLPEQRKIAEILDTIDEAIRKTEEIIDKLKHVKQGLLHDLLTRGIDDNGELRDPDRHPDQFKNSPLGRIPKAWRTPVLDDLTVPSSPITYGVVKPGPHDENGVAFVRGGDFPRGRILVDRLRTITRAVSQEYKRTLLEGGEVLVSLVGQPGACAVVPPALAGANIARQAALIRPGEGLLPEFLRDFISAPRVQRALLGDTLGSVQQVVNLRDLRKLTVLLPPLEEQVEVARRVAAVQEQQDAESVALGKFAAVKRGLMDDLLTGRVRVPGPGRADSF